ncbi:MAG: DNA polymerase I [Actinobacteria bacterium]|nr:DNA polymerase I [Actinomycetota bacterium]
MKNKIILIDGNNIAYRAFYALPQTIATTDGTITNAVYGFTTMVLKLIDEYKPDYIIAAFDSKTPTFRHELFKEYKAQRMKMPEDLISQLPLIKEVLETINIKCIDVEGYEADDIIATLANKLTNDFNEILIVSGDKDILQLVNDKIKVMALKRGITDTVTYDAQGVIEKLGVTPDKIKDLLALTGDSSDNIPGIKGIGPKSALELVKEYGNIEEIYKHIHEIKNEKIKNLLEENNKLVFDSRKLTELVTNLNLNINNLLAKKLNEVNFKKVEEIFSSLEFKTLKERIKKNSIYSSAFQINDNNKIKTDNGLNNKLITEEQKLKNINFNVFDLNFDSEEFLKNSNGKIFLELYDTYLSEEKSNKEESGEKNIKNLIIYNDFDNPYVFYSNFFRDEKYLKIIKNILENKNIIKSGYNLKEIYKYLKKYNIEVNGFFHDFMIFYLLLNPDKTYIEINELIKIYFPDINSEYLNLKFNQPEKNFKNKTNSNINNISDTDNNDNNANNLKSNKNQLSFYSENNINENPDIGIPNSNFNENYIENDNFKISLNNILHYKKLEEILLNEIKNNELYELYEKIEGPLIKVLAEMEFTGITVDKEYLEILIKQYEEEINKLVNEIYETSGEKFNINSPRQLSSILFKKLNLASSKKTKTGYSTDISTLASLIDKNPIVAKVIDYREKVKLKNTYIDVLPNLIDPQDNRIHTTYNQLGTTTGRISSSDPNLQNIPVRTELGRQIRKAFVPGQGYDYLLSSDYSQIELRILAHLSEDEKLIDIFNKNGDIHTFTASEIFGVDIKHVTEELRRKAKAINFGIIYGMTEYGLKSRLSINEDEAREYINLYFKRYPKVKSYINYLIKEAYKKGFTTTLFGRRRYINELSSSNRKLRSLGERLAVNTPIQGTAADIMKLATVKLYNDIRDSKIDANILLQVHDELVLEIKNKDLEEIKKIVKNAMENCVNLKVAIKVDIKVAENWYN